MESRWYLAPGQTVENTKVSDRTHALHVTATEWKKITDQLDRKKIIAEAIEHDRAHKQALKDGSEAMTKNWPNSIQYQHIRKEQERKKRIEELEEQRRENFNVIQKEQEEVRDDFIKKVKKRMFYAKAYPKELSSALMTAEVLYERQKQLEFQKIIDAHNGEVERQYVERVNQAAADEVREKQEKAAQTRQQKQELKETYQKAIEEKETIARKKRDRQLRQEQEDNIMAQAELELQQQMQREDLMRDRAERKKVQLDYLEKTRETKRMLRKEDDEVDQVMMIFQNVKRDIECLRNEKVAEKYKKENHIVDDEDKHGRENCEPSPQDKMLNTTPGKRQHDPRTDPNYHRCRCHKDEIIK